MIGLLQRVAEARVVVEGECVGAIDRGLLVLLAADTRKGLRPSFTGAAPPELGRRLFEHAVAVAREKLPGKVATGRFGADMKVSLTNDGPVTFWLRISAGNENG